MQLPTVIYVVYIYKFLEMHENLQDRSAKIKSFLFILAEAETYQVHILCSNYMKHSTVKMLIEIMLLYWSKTPMQNILFSFVAICLR